MTHPAPRLSLPAFRCGLRVFTVDDVLAAARDRGAFESFQAAWRERRSAVRQAAAAEQIPSAAELEAAIESFRYARDLVSGEECDRWLEARGLDFEDLVDSITRRMQSTLTAEKPDAPVESEDDRDTEAEDERLLIVDVLLADEFNAWARRLARSIALAAHSEPARFADSSEGLRWAELDERLDAAMAAITTPARRQTALAGHRLNLLRVEFEQAEFDSAGAAREAVLCTREDQASLRATAEANAFPCQVATAFLGDLPPTWAEVLTSARLGEAVIPRDSDGCFVVLAPLGRQEPSLDDPEVCARVDAALVEQHFRELEANHIRWLINVDLTT